MERDTREVRAGSVGSVADAYERARPGYPEECLAWLAGEPPRDVVDLGAGTGKLTRQLVAAGHRVVAVEPSVEMLARLREVVPGATALPGSAEAIPLADGAADVVVAAQAFHWFDRALALPEIARVLRPGGRLGLVWNARDGRVPWVARLSQVIGGDSWDDEELVGSLAESGLFGPVEARRFASEQRLGRELLRDLVRSRSYVAVRPPAEQEAILADVDRVYDEHAGPDGLVLSYATRAFRARRA